MHDEILMYFLAVRLLLKDFLAVAVLSPLRLLGFVFLCNMLSMSLDQPATNFSLGSLNQPSDGYALYDSPLPFTSVFYPLNIGRSANSFHCTLPLCSVSLSAHVSSPFRSSFPMLLVFEM